MDYKINLSKGAHFGWWSAVLGYDTTDFDTPVVRWRTSRARAGKAAMRWCERHAKREAAYLAEQEVSMHYIPKESWRVKDLRPRSGTGSEWHPR